MANEGIKGLIGALYYPIIPIYEETLIDLFRKLIDFEKSRGKEAGINLYAAIAIDP